MGVDSSSVAHLDQQVKFLNEFDQYIPMTSNSHIICLLCLISLFSCSVQADVCTNVTCGHGKCVLDAIGLGLLYHCECDAGWKTIQVGPMSIGTCGVPNCSLDYSCGGKDPPTPPFTAPNFTSPGCNLVYCGDGVCALNATGAGHTCQCHERAANLFNDPQNLCIQQCYLDGDCGHLKLLSPPPPSKAAPGAGKNAAPYSLTKLPPVLVAIFTAIFLSRM